jgi:hypothetical protein
MEYVIYSSLTINIVTLLSVVKMIFDVKSLSNDIDDLTQKSDSSSLEQSQLDPDRDLTRRLAELQNMKFSATSLRRIK